MKHLLLAMGYVVCPWTIRSSDHWKVPFAWQSDLRLREIDHIAHLPHWGEGSATREPQIQKHHRNIKIRKARVLEPREPSTDLKLHPQFKKNSGDWERKDIKININLVPILTVEVHWKRRREHLETWESWSIKTSRFTSIVVSTAGKKLAEASHRSWRYFLDPLDELPNTSQLKNTEHG